MPNRNLSEVLTEARRTIQREDLERSIDAYNELREKIVKLIEKEPSLLSEGAWMSNLISEHHIDTIHHDNAGITFSGWRYSNQTCDNEYFEGTLPWELVL